MGVAVVASPYRKISYCSVVLPGIVGDLGVVQDLHQRLVGIVVRVCLSQFVNRQTIAFVQRHLHCQMYSTKEGRYVRHEVDIVLQVPAYLPFVDVPAQAVRHEVIVQK